jgi:hypothetical protein
LSCQRAHGHLNSDTDWSIESQAHVDEGATMSRFRVACCDSLAQHEVQHDDNGEHERRKDARQAEIV